jgi:long-chain acyl-CoA synthetase
MNESVSALFAVSAQRFNKRPAFQYFCKSQNNWVTKNWQEVFDQVEVLAASLYALGVKPKDRIAIISNTRPEWVVVDLAVMRVGAILVPIYQSSLSDQISYIMRDAGTTKIFVENQEQLAKIRNLPNADQDIEKVIIFDETMSDLRRNEVYYDDFIKPAHPPAPHIEVHSKDIATIVYTSGTTGEPKGAMISHDNLLYESMVIDKVGLISEADVQLMFLPLAHIFARVLEVAWLRTGHLLAFSQSVDKIIENMSVIRPTFMAGVPRVFEKIRAKVIATALEQSPLKRTIAKFAFQAADELSKGGKKSAGCKLFFAKKVVFDKIGKSLSERFGGRLRFLISGGAQLGADVATFFQLAGIVLCEGYGLTETTAATCLNLPWSMRLGTVGRPLPGTEVRLNADGEVCVRGRGVFLGFWKKEQETADVLSSDGWFKTGDLGKIDADGFLKLIDRKKDIIVTSQGKNISPQRVENIVKSKSPLIAHVVVIGDKKPYMTALIALDQANTTSFLQTLGQKNPGTLVQMATKSEVYNEVKNAVSSANASLATFEQIKRFQILLSEFTIGEELTPSMKVKRKLCAEKFSKEIARLYS